MPQEFVRSKIVFFAVFLAFGLVAAAFGQTGTLQTDLQNSFKKFNLVKVGNKLALQKAQIENRLTIQTAEKSFDLDLTPNDLRSARYRAENTTADGVLPLENDVVTTFKGKISGEADSTVRVTIDESKIEGYFISNGEMFVVEPARKYSQAAGRQDYVVYNPADLINPPGFTCDADVSSKIEKGREMLATGAVQSAQETRIIEVATEADFEFVTRLGSANKANREILDILNMVDGVYQAELNLKISVVYQHAWSIADPFIPTTTNTLLVSFKDYWNTNFPAAEIPRDTAHLFSGKPTVAGQGLSYMGIVCKNTAFAYGLSGRIDFAPVKFQLTAHEIGHNLGASHVDATQSCANSIMNSILTDATQFSFCTFSRTEITNFVAAGNSCLSLQVVVKNKFDYDGDGRADISLFRPSDKVWYILNSSGGISYNQFGLSTDKIVPADFDGDGKTDIAVYRPENGTWYIMRSGGGVQYVQFGLSEDFPVPADYNGDGKAEIAVYRPSSGLWFILNSDTQQYSLVQFGASEDKPVAADYNGDGKSEIAVYRPSLGIWFIYNWDTKQYTSTKFGISTDKPVPADYNGDGKTDIAVYRPNEGNWYIATTSGGYTVTQFGLPTDLPTPADYDGDGKTDIAVYRPSEGNWYQLNSGKGFKTTKFGIETDKPTETAFLR